MTNRDLTGRLTNILYIQSRRTSGISLVEIVKKGDLFGKLEAFLLSGLFPNPQVLFRLPSSVDKIHDISWVIFSVREKR